VPRQVERQDLLQPDQGTELLAVARFGQLVERVVGALDVGGVVLVAMQLKSFADDGSSRAASS